MLRIVFLHYHAQPGGVSRVIQWPSGCDFIHVHNPFTASHPKYPQVKLNKQS
ncbi:MAG: hypothetical protein N2442_13360 [Spirochaetes bacterium]|nr:hypothetical protein [Spirochaetota bacterium]